MSRRERRAKEKQEQEEEHAKKAEQLQRGWLEREKYKRDESQICLTCRFWVQLREGRCRRYPPSVKSGPTNRIDMWVFPEVTHDQWCGEWQPLSNKDGYDAVAAPIDEDEEE